MTSILYLHGFASGPSGRKAQLFASYLRGMEATLGCPDLNVPSFAKLTVSGALDQIDTAASNVDGPVAIIGSSMGGYLAALWASRNPQRVERLVLLCPGFLMAQRWPERVGTAVMARWERQGALTIPDGDGTPTPLHWEFVADGRRHNPWPAVPCPTLIIHGIEDETVPVETSRRYVKEHPLATLLEVPDGHRLLGDFPRVAKATSGFLGLGEPPE